MICKVALHLAACAISAGAMIAVPTNQAHAATITPTGIDPTGAADDTAALQSLIDNLPDGYTLSFPPGAKYRIEGTLHVRNKHNVTVEGNGSLFFATTTGDRTRSQWSFEGGSHIVVRNVIVRGANPNAGKSDDAYVSSLEAQHAFNIWSTDGIELDRVTATDVYGDFVYIGAQGNGLARNVYIHDSTFARNGRQGISVTGGNGVRIIQNNISDTRRATFDLEPNGSTWGALNVDIEYNRIGTGRLNLLSGGGVGPLSSLVFAHNTVNRPFTMMVGDSSGARRGPITIADNTATQDWGSAAGSAALTFKNIDGLTVTGNVIPLQANRGDYGVKATDSCDVTITGNTFTNAVAPALVTPGPDCASTSDQSAAPVTGPTPTSSMSSTTSPTATPTVTQTSSSAPSTTSPAPSTQATTPNGTPRNGKSSQAPATSSSKTPAAGIHNGKGPTKPKGNAALAATGKSGTTSSYVAPELASLTTDSAWNSHMWQRGLYTAIAAAVLLLGWLRLSKTGVSHRRKTAQVRTTPRHPGLATTVWGSSERFPQRHVR